MDGSDRLELGETEPDDAFGAQDRSAQTEPECPGDVVLDPSSATFAEWDVLPSSLTLADDEVHHDAAASVDRRPSASDHAAETLYDDRRSAPSRGAGFDGRARVAPTVPGYEILGELGRGGMGVVYKARQIRLNRVCALKMILAGAHADAPAAQRFQDEAEAIAQLQHPNVVQIYSFGEVGGLPYLELEYLEGGSLQERLDGTPLPPERAARLIEGLARGVAAAHARGLIHRDIKPGNVLLSGDGVPKVADFGLVKGTESVAGLTVSGSVIGSPSYMAPEQAEGKGKEVGPAADVYGLGAILYELLTGRPPFRGVTVLQTLEQVRSAEPVRPCRLVPGLPRDIETIGLKCLQKSAGDRYPSAASLAEDLRLFLAREPILARPISPVERALKWARRRPGGAALVAALMTTLLGLLALGAWSYWRISHALIDEQSARAGAVAETYRALLSDTRSLRLARPAGWRRDATRNLGEMAALDTPKRNPVELRTEAVSCLGVIDVREVARFEGVAGVRSLDFSPDSATLATAGYDGRLRLWSLSPPGHLRVIDDPAMIYPLPYTEEAPLPAVRYQPGGNRLAYATWSRRVEWLNPVGSNPAGPALEGRTQPCGIAFDSVGRRVAVSWVDGWITVHDAQSGAVLRTLSDPALGWYFHPVALSPDGTQLAASGPDHTVRLHRIDSTAEPVLLGRHTDFVRSLAYSPDGKTLASASMDNSVKLWDVEKGEERLALRGHSARLNAVAFHPDGNLLASAGDDETVRLWDARTGLVLMVLRPGIESVLSVGFSPDGLYLACGHDTVCLYEIAGLHERRELKGHTYTVYDAAFHPDDSVLVSASANHEVFVWDSRTGRSRRRWRCDPISQQPLESLALSPSDRIVAIGTGEYPGVLLNPDFSVHLWDIDSGPPGRLLAGPKAPVAALAFDPKGERLAAGAWDGSLFVWDRLSGRELLADHVGGGRVNSVAFLDLGRRVVAAASDGRVVVYDLAGKAPPRATTIPGGIARCAVTADEARLVVGGVEGDLTLVNLADLATALTRKSVHQGPIRGVAITPDGKHLITGGDDHRVLMHDPDTLQTRFAFPPHDGPVHKLAVSPDGCRLAIAGVEQQVIVWDLNSLEQQFATIGLSWNSFSEKPSEVPLETLSVKVPAPKSAIDRAWDFMGLGETLRAANKPADAIWPYRQAELAWREILIGQPDHPFLQSEMAVTLAAIADIQRATGQPDQAARSIDKALVLVEPLRHEDPRVAFNHCRVLALASLPQGPRGGPLADRAITFLRRAIAAGYKDRRQINENPDLDPIRDRADFQVLVADRSIRLGWPFLLQRGRSRLRQGRIKEAIADGSQCQSILSMLLATDPAEPALLSPWAASAVDLAAARRLADEPRDDDRELSRAIDVLKALKEPAAADWLTLARAYALRTEHDGQAAKHALRALREAVARGFRDREFLTSDPALKSLRGRADFRDLNDDLAFPSSPAEIFQR